jgi:hypothetical protein
VPAKIVDQHRPRDAFLVLVVTGVFKLFLIRAVDTMQLARLHESAGLSQLPDVMLHERLPCPAATLGSLSAHLHPDMSADILER